MDIEENESPNRKSAHLVITSAIYSLKRITNKLIKEKQKKFANDNVISECVDLCNIFIKQLK